MKQIDKAFKTKLYNYEVEVPEGMWEQIMPEVKDDKGRVILWLWLAGLLALLIGGALYYFANSAKQNYELSRPLAQVEPIESNSSQLITSTVEHTLEESLTTNPTEQRNIDTKNDEIVKKQTTQKRNTKTSTSRVKPQVSIETVEPIQRKQAHNFVITKSFISDEGTIVKTTEVPAENNTPSYDVLINDNGNVGIDRSILPVEILPLPTLQSNTIKKKMSPQL